MKLTKLSLALAVLAALSLFAAACGDDEPSNGSGDTSAPTTGTTATTATTAPTTTIDDGSTAPPQETDCETDPIIQRMDATGDNMVRFGVATAGPRDDGGYYQALVEAIEEFSSATPCLGTPIIVDSIQAAEADTELRNLAQQDVDIIAVGASEIAEPLADLTTEFSDIFWYCNCGAGYQPLDTLAQSQDDSSEISYTAGYATGLLLQESGDDSVAFLGCCDLGFEKEAYMAFELGLKAVDDTYSMTYTQTGNFPFDFDNSQGAVEAAETAISQGAGALNPYLGGAHEPVVQLANDENIIVMSAGASDACERTDLNYDIAVRFDAGDYIVTLLEELAAGAFNEGDIRVFRVGVDPQPGAVICDPTPDQQLAMDEIYQRIANGEFVADFGAIKGAAYAS